MAQDGGKRNLIIAAAVLVALVGGLLYVMLHDDGPLPNQVEFVDVATGEIFMIRQRDIEAIPMLHPSTNEPTLLPVYREGDEILVDPHYAHDNLEKLAEVNRYVDSSTLKVRKAPG